ncbi:UNVERIFIED_CONTAM: protein CHUP1, chloroplastic [Sesamum radiatum]|uniref:Protein CHUP1, chloroplastic n=1 Tax=Sesamum radiatum TaxID=300843 RepID=A0AAW2T0R5_SESRA
MTASLDVEKRTLRIPNPPPRPSCAGLSGPKEETSTRTSPPALAPPPPPPPPPPKLMARSMTGTVQRAPQVVEFYHSLMKRESRKDCLNSGATDASDVANVRSSMIGEIENRSSHLLAVDERAVLKHFEWPEKKADTLREAAFGYSDLRKLDQEVSNYRDDARLPCDIALKKMAALSERLDAMDISKSGNGTSVQGTSDKDSSLDYMLLQGVRFAFRIHQFAGGFDAETMQAFEELRDLAVVLNKS